MSKGYTKDEMMRIVAEEFENKGVDVSDQEAVDNIDSLEYISILVALEEQFEMEFPDTVLSRNLFADMEEFYKHLGWILGIDELDD